MTFPNSAATEPKIGLLRYYPWLVVGIAFLTVGTAFGSRAAFALFFVAVIEEFNWSRGLSAGVLTLGSVVWTLVAPFIGYLLDRFGPRVVIPAGATIMASGFVVSSLTQHIFHFYIGMGLLVGLGFAAMPMTTQATIISNWFIRRRGLAMGITASGIGAGILIVVPITQHLITRLGWRQAYLILSALLVLMIVPLNFFFQRRRPEDVGLLPDSGRFRAGVGVTHRGREEQDDWTLRKALRSFRFWAFAVGTLTGAIPLHLVLVHQVAAVVDAGFSKTLAASILGLTGLFTVFTMIATGSLSDRVGRGFAYILGSSFLILAICVLLFVNDPSQRWMLYLFAPLFAIGFASRQSLYPTIAADLFHGKHFGAIIGVVALFIGAGAGLGPWLGGFLFDLSGSYASSLWIAILLAAISMACIWLAVSTGDK